MIFELSYRSDFRQCRTVSAELLHVSQSAELRRSIAVERFRWGEGIIPLSCLCNLRNYNAKGQHPKELILCPEYESD